MRDRLYHRTIALPLSVWEEVERIMEDENFRSLNQAMIAVVRNGVVRIKMERERYRTLSPTIQQDEAMR